MKLIARHFHFVKWFFESWHNFTWTLSGLIRLHPVKKRWVIACTPNKRVIEIDITAVCPVGCYNCDRAVGIIPSKAAMTVDQVQRFVDESITINWGWKSIILIGGEPLAHPKFFDIIDVISIYKQNFPSTRIEVCTSGYGGLVSKRLTQIPDWVIITNTNKIGPKQEFKTVNIAPIDIPKYQKSDFSKGCVITEYGIALNHNGYFPCGAGGTVDRVFDCNVGYQSLEQALNSSMREQLSTLCQYCGHFKRTEERVTEQVSSKTWDKVIHEHNNKVT